MHRRRVSTEMRRVWRFICPARGQAAAGLQTLCFRAVFHRRCSKSRRPSSNCRGTKADYNLGVRFDPTDAQRLINSCTPRLQYMGDGVRECGESRVPACLSVFKQPSAEHESTVPLTDALHRFLF